MTSDGVRTYSYDGENRLIKVIQGSSTWHYVYDYLGRRIEKRGTGITKTRFLYDGWNVIAELDGSNTIVRRFAWGLDVSGSLQGAGGIGGLLVIDAGAQYHPLYDASHNVIGLYNSSGSLQAAYAYDAFGNLQTSAGTYATSNPFRSATKYTDSETGFVYYGMRYYSPMLGRFINRDPIEEGGGLNLYLFCKNDGVNQSDYLGMNAFTDWTIAILNAIGSFFGNASSDVEVLDRMIVTPGEDDSNVSKPSDDSPGYLSMVASNRAVTDYQNENTMDESAPNSAGGSALGNALRNVPLIGGILGGVGDMVAGVGNTALGIASFGQSGTFGRGLGQIGSGLSVFGMDAAAMTVGTLRYAANVAIQAADVATFGNIRSEGNPLRAIQ